MNDILIIPNSVLRQKSLSLKSITKKDIDLSLFFDYNVNKSSYYFNFYWMPRHTNRDHLFKRANGYEIDNIIISVGGGGLIAGIGSVIRQKFPKCKNTKKME